MSNQTILTGEAYRNFIEAVHSPYTRISYRNSLQLYMEYRKIDDCQQLLEGDPRLIQDQLRDYIIYLREELKVATSTINNRIAAVKKFYETNDIELKWRKIKSYKDKQQSSGSDMLTESPLMLTGLDDDDEDNDSLTN